MAKPHSVPTGDMSHLNKYKADMEEIAGQWNGDESGLQEDRANAALEAIEHLNALQELFKELNY